MNEIAVLTSCSLASSDFMLSPTDLSCSSSSVIFLQRQQRSQIVGKVSSYGKLNYYIRLRFRVPETPCNCPARWSRRIGPIESNGVYPLSLWKYSEWIGLIKITWLKLSQSLRMIMQWHSFPLMQRKHMSVTGNWSKPYSINVVGAGEELVLLTPRLLPDDLQWFPTSLQRLPAYELPVKIWPRNCKQSTTSSKLWSYV